MKNVLVYRIGESYETLDLPVFFDISGAVPVSFQTALTKQDVFIVQDFGMNFSEQDVFAMIQGLLDNGRKIGAIKLAKSAFGLGLKEAKYFVESNF